MVRFLTTKEGDTPSSRVIKTQLSTEVSLSEW